MSNLNAQLAKQLAQQQSATMQKNLDSNKNKKAEDRRAYMEMLMNPFTTTIKNPKLLDGEVKYSAAMKLRATGEIECSATGNTNIILFPGLTNVICYCSAPAGGDNYVGATPTNGDVVLDPIVIDGTIFPAHLGTATDRGAVRLGRLTGAALRLWLTNSAEEDDGYWEAARIISHSGEQDVVFKDDNSTPTNLGGAVLKALNSDLNIVGNPSYQFGQLRDIHKMVFKLNSTDNDHKFSPIASLNANYTDTNPVKALADMDQWDMIFIKIRGRRNATTPSILRFDSVANQELVYADTSPLARLMDGGPREPNIQAFLEHSRVELPAFQVAS